MCKMDCHVVKVCQTSVKACYFFVTLHKERGRRDRKNRNDVNVGTVINIKNVNFGGLDLNNIRASVVRNQKAPLLLGQSVLARLGKIEIDNAKKVIKITQ